MMTGIIPITSGSIQINGFDVEKDDLSAKRQIGYVSDDPNVFLRLKGIEYLNFVADMYEVPSDLRTQRIEKLAGQMDTRRARGKDSELIPRHASENRSRRLAAARSCRLDSR